MFEALRHHDETNLRPKFVDHMLAMGLLGGLAGAFGFGGSLRGIVTGTVFSLTTIAPIMYWMMVKGIRPGASTNCQPGIFYQDDCSKDEIARF